MFDLILEEAVKRNLKPEQMVKKVFVFNHPGFEQYNKNKQVIPYKQPGLTVLTGFSNKLFKLFLENDGEFGPEHVMEVAISGDEFQSLAVVD
ncbi:hypothetical protein Pyn_06224 [Prunus yedoensis var. nudiflora]|uniref:DUF7788 domain-containing protein n=1 Tax=Prunus yedoensis var. nudiflora TaxID=2094558 RepID=A0A314XII0_PRUYE|nr:hypothetical protein Pyn_06224 [Prunus yedoensis var. nudiflora]